MPQEQPRSVEHNTRSPNRWFRSMKNLPSLFQPLWWPHRKYRLLNWRQNETHVVAESERRKNLRKIKKWKLRELYIAKCKLNISNGRGFLKVYFAVASCFSSFYSIFSCSLHLRIVSSVSIRNCCLLKKMEDTCFDHFHGIYSNCPFCITGQSFPQSPSSSISFFYLTFFVKYYFCWK